MHRNGRSCGVFASHLRSCFFRQGLLGTARDRLPFLWRLTRAFSLDEEWEDYLRSPAETHRTNDRHEPLQRREAFTVELQKPFAHAQRALRNRVEHRSLQADPPIPHTLGHGACKLINAYSTVFYLACELFRGAAPDREQAPGDIRRFAVVVCTGSCGHVECEELYADFREYFEAPGGRYSGRVSFSGLLLSEGPETRGWSDRLLLLDPSVPIMGETTASWVITVEGKEVEGWRKQGCWG